MGAAWLGSAQRVFSDVQPGESGMEKKKKKKAIARCELQVVIPDSLKSVVSMEIVAADVVG